MRMVNSVSLALRRKFLIENDPPSQQTHDLVPREFPAKSSPRGVIQIQRQGKNACCKKKKKNERTRDKARSSLKEDQFMIKSGEHSFLKSTHAVYIGA